MAYNFDEIYGEEPAVPSTAPAAPPARLADGGYDFDSIYGTEPVTATPQAATQASIYDASFGNPDEAAQRRQVARDLEKFLGDTTPASVIDIPDAQRRLRVAEADHATRASPRTSAWLSNAENAAIAADDAKTLANIERILDDFQHGGMKPSTGPELSLKSLAGGLSEAFTQGAERARQGIRQQFADLFDLEDMSAGAQRKFEQAQSREFLATPEIESTTGRAIYGGLRSTARQIPGLAASILTRSTTPMLAAAGIQTEAEAYGKYKARGGLPGEAFAGAVGEGAVEVLTELIPLRTMLGAFGEPGKKAATEFLKSQVQEQFGEQAATLLQDAIDTAVANPDKTWGDYWRERPGAAYETFIATLTQSGVMGGVHYAAGRLAQREAEGAQVEAGAQTLQELFAAAEQSLTRGRDTQTFDAFFQDVAGDATVFVDPVVLRQAAEQAGIDEARLPSLTEQSAEAANVGAGVEIPVAELVSAFTGTGIEQQIIENTRMAPDAATLAEVRADGVKAMEFFQAEAAKALEQATQQEEFRTAAETVRNDVLTEIKAAAPESITTPQQEGYASLVGSFYSTIASRMGITPLQLRDGWTDAAGAPHRGYRLGVLNEQMRAARMTGAQFDQARNFSEFDRAVQGDLFAKDFVTKRTTLTRKVVVSSRGATETVKLPNVDSTGRQITATRQGLENFWAFYGTGPVDSKGRPILLYHSTNADIAAFEAGRATVNNFGLLGDVETTRAGIFATPNLKFSQEYLRPGAGQNVMPIYMALQNPIDLREGLTEQDEKALEDAGINTRFIHNAQNQWELFDNDDEGKNTFVDALKALGYDGAIIAEESPGGESKGGDTYVAFDPTQIKSVFNRGTFSRTDPNILLQSANDFLTAFDAADTIELVAPTTSEEEIDRAQDEFLSAFPEGSRYPRDTRLLARIRRASEKALDALDGSPETDREVASTLGPFSAYNVGAEVLEGDSLNPNGSLRVTIFGKEQVEAGLTDEPALTITVTADGELTLNGPSPNTATFEEFKARGWADYARGADGTVQTGWSALKDPTNPDKPLPITQILPLLADTHARVREWRGEDYVGMHWTRATGALGGLFDQDESAVFFQERAQQRGAFSPRTLDISFLANADASTFLHETGHFFLTVYADLASQPDAPAEIKADMDVLLKWFGVTGQEKGLPGGAELAQAAYHGSPYRFDKFSLEHLGKGEGAQAFGWGLYFAGKREIAEYYRNTLAGDVFLKADGTVFRPDTLEHMNVRVLATRGNLDGAIDKAKAIVAGDSPVAEMAARDLEILQGIKDSGGLRKAEGQLYEVEIPEDGEYLLWDKPLSEQPEKVRKALAASGVRPTWKILDANGDGLGSGRGATANEALADWKKVAGKNAGKGVSAVAADFETGQVIYRDASKERGGDEAASKYLHSLGIAGIKYADATARGKTEDSFNYVIFDENAVEIAQTFYQGGEVPAPGPLPAGRTPLEVWNSLSLDQQRPYHEQFAETFEQYLFTGKAPTKELQPLFRRFAKWLTSVYGSLRDFVARNKGAKLNEEVSAIFDRMLATDAEIEAMRAARAYTQLFRNATEAGMTPADFAAYQALDPESISEAEEQLRTRGLRDMKWLQNRRNKVIAELQEDAKARRAEVRAEVEKEVAERPLYRAMRFLKRGETTAPDGTEIKAEAGHKLRIADVEAIFPTAEGVDLRKLGYGRYGMLAEEGLPPDMVAEIFGFTSGETLVRQLLDAPKFRDEVEGLTDQRMLEQYGDLSSPQDIERAADEAIHNDARTRMVATELHFLGKSIGKPGVLIKAAREYARQIVETKSLKTLKPANFVAEETRAGKAAMESLRKGDREEAARLKRTELLNHAAAKEAYAAAKEMEKIVNRLKKIADTKDEAAARSREMDMVNATRAILAEFGIGRHGDKAAAYLKTVEALDPDMSAALDDIIGEAAANARDYRTLPLRELRELGSMVDAIWSMAKSAKQVQVEGKRLQLDDVRRELTDKLLETAKAPKQPKGLNLTKAETAKVKFARLATQMKRPEAWVGMKDGADTFGPWRRYIWKTINDAQTALTQEKAARLKQMKDLVRPVLQDMVPQRIEAPEIGVTFGAGDTLGYSELLHALLHTGNESNKRKLLLGRGWATERADGTLDTTKWDVLIARLHREGKLTKRHWDFVQSVWDFMEDLKPGAQRAHKEAFGRYFDEVTAAPIDTPFGQYKGGYVPARADRLQVADADLKAMTEAGWNSMLKAFPASRRGFTKGRVEYNVILELNLQSLTRHVDEVLTFTHMNGPVRDVQRILKGGELSSVLAVQDREAINYLILPWLQHAAQQTVTLQGNQNWENWKIWSKLRSRTGAAIMFANLKNVTQQLTSFFPALLKVKPTYLLHAAATNVLAPRDLAKHVAALSPYMNQRINDETYALASEIDGILLNPTKLEHAQHWSMKHAYFMQMAVDNWMAPTIWLAKYNETMESAPAGMTEAEIAAHERKAIELADSAVRMTQGAMRPIDVAAFEGGSPFARMFTQFAGFFSTQMNLMGEQAVISQQMPNVKQKYARLGMIAFLGWYAPAIASEIISVLFAGGPPDEDKDGDYLDDWLRQILVSGPVKYATAMVPIAGQGIQAVVNAFNDKPYDDRLGNAPAVGALESAGKAAGAAYKLATDPDYDPKPGPVIRDTGMLLSILTGLPVLPAAKSIGYLTDVESGRISPTSPADLARGTITGVASPESK